jgi:phage baseplate assembly protein W
MTAYKSGAVSPKTNEVIFKDLGLSFVPHPITKKLPVLKNEDAIKRAVRNLILTNNYERFYNPFFGGDITSYLFENFSPITKASIEKSVKDAIEVYEQRVDLLEVDINQKDDMNELIVNIIFRPKNQIQKTQLSFTVERVR